MFVKLKPFLMYIKLKLFLMYTCLFVFLSIVFETQWHMTTGSAELAAALGNTAVFVIVNLLRYSREGSDRG